ncbi:hypothetical protein N9P82_01395 [bacterium]|nr:hypothetical protein [bacterium]
MTCEYPRRAAGCTALHRRRHRTTGIETASMSATTSSASLSAVVSINAAHTRGAVARRAARAAQSSSGSDRASSMIVRCDKAQGSTSDASTSAPLRLDRRALFTGAACLTAASSLTLAAPQPARAVFDGSDSKMVGAYLPAGPDGLFQFEAHPGAPRRCPRALLHPPPAGVQRSAGIKRAVRELLPAAVRRSHDRGAVRRFQRGFTSGEFTLC